MLRSLDWPSLSSYNSSISEKGLLDNASFLLTWLIQLSKQIIRLGKLCNRPLKQIIWRGSPKFHACKRKKKIHQIFPFFIFQPLLFVESSPSKAEIFSLPTLSSSSYSNLRWVCILKSVAWRLAQLFRDTQVSGLAPAAAFLLLSTILHVCSK